MAYIDTVKQWFLRKKKPTQEQYHQLFDFLRFKDQALSVDDITNLTTILQQKVDQSVFNAIAFGTVQEDLMFAGDRSYHIARGWLLESVIIRPASDSEIKIGTAVGLDDIFPAKIINAIFPECINLNQYTEDEHGLDIFFAGIPEDTEVIFLKRKIKELVETPLPLTLAKTVNNGSVHELTIQSGSGDPVVIASGDSGSIDITDGDLVSVTLADTFGLSWNTTLEGTEVANGEDASPAMIDFGAVTSYDTIGIGDPSR